MKKVQLSIIPGLVNAIIKARKGIHLTNLIPLTVVGCKPGIKCIEYSRLMGYSRPAAYKSLARAIKKRLIYKERKLYYLTDHGVELYKLIDGSVRQQIDMFKRATWKKCYLQLSSESEGKIRHLESIIEYLRKQIKEA